MTHIQDAEDYSYLGTLFADPMQCCTRACLSKSHWNNLSQLLQWLQRTATLSSAIQAWTQLHTEPENTEAVIEVIQDNSPPTAVLGIVKHKTGRTGAERQSPPRQLLPIQIKFTRGCVLGTMHGNHSQSIAPRDKISERIRLLYLTHLQDTFLGAVLQMWQAVASISVLAGDEVSSLLNTGIRIQGL